MDFILQTVASGGTSTLFGEISIILAVAALVGGVFFALKQPLIVAYIITGMIVGPFGLDVLESVDETETLAKFGIALLLFIIGLGLNPKVIREVGPVAVSAGMGQVATTSLISFGLALLLDYSLMASAYIALSITFSSTIIILKVLSDKKELNRLHGKLATGILLVQDVAAAVLLIVISASTSESGSIDEALIALLVKGGAFVVALVVMSKYVLPTLVQKIAKSQEFLFIFSLGWGFGVASLAELAGLSLEIGALAAGVSLAALPYAFEIGSRMRPLRDFFVVIFFVLLGAQVEFGDLGAVMVPALVLSVFILIGNPLIVMILTALNGYTRKTSFRTGITMGQISEFSLVVIIAGVSAGHVDGEVKTLITLMGLITITISTYMMQYDMRLFAWLDKYLGVLERKNLRSEGTESPDFNVVLFGYKPVSEPLLRHLKKVGKLLVIDYDPEMVDHLEGRGVAARFGDANDLEFLEELELSGVKLAVINVSEKIPNMMIIDHLREHAPKATIIATSLSNSPVDSMELYDHGATLVVSPHAYAAQALGKLVKKAELKKTPYKEEGKKQRDGLERMG